MLKNIGTGLGAAVVTFAVDSWIGDEIREWADEEFGEATDEIKQLASTGENQDTQNQQLKERVGRSVAAGVGAAIASRIR